jgi:hypothetical protein
MRVKKKKHMREGSVVKKIRQHLVPSSGVSDDADRVEGDKVVESGEDFKLDVPRHKVDLLGLLLQPSSSGVKLDLGDLREPLWSGLFRPVYLHGPHQTRRRGDGTHAHFRRERDDHFLGVQSRRHPEQTVIPAKSYGTQKKQATGKGIQDEDEEYAAW